MVICFFSTQYLPTPGGVERYTWNLARRCVAAGHRALVVTAALPGLPARQTDADGIEIFRLPSWPVMGGRFPVLKPFAPADALWAQDIDFASGLRTSASGAASRRWSSTTPPAI